MRKYYLLMGMFAAIAAGCNNNSTNPPAAAPTHFMVTPLASNKASYGAANIDTNLQDSWGLAFNTNAGYPWIANRASGTTTVYDSLGSRQQIMFSVKGPGNSKGNPTGIAFIAPPTTFPFRGSDATWIFSELDGTIAGIIAGAIADSTQILVDNSQNSSYTGLALVTAGGTPILYAPNVKNGSLDEFDQSFHRTQSGGENYNNGYTPFNAVVIDTQLFVTEAKMANGFVATGAGNGGYIDVYSLNGTFEKTLISNNSLDEPWGVAIAPANFGSFSGDLLVGNFGDGTIHAYNRSTGALIGTLTDASNNPIVISGLWALVVYNGTLYYTAGPNGGTDGVFGKITLQ